MDAGRIVAEARHLWWLIAAAVVAGFAAGGVVSEIWAAPDIAEQALSLAERNSRTVDDLEHAVDRLDRTVRIVFCSQADLDRTTRARLYCSEFD